MRVRVVKSFVDGKYGRKSRGAEFEMPDAVDWLKAGLVEPVEPEIEVATKKAPRKAVVKKTNARKPRKPAAKKD